MLWTAFPTVFSAIMTTFYIPSPWRRSGSSSGGGIRVPHAARPVRRPATRVFGVSSVLTPFFMGTVVGAVASGEVPADGGDPTASWTGILPLLTGVMFVAIAAYVAAVFLVTTAGAPTTRTCDYFDRAFVMAVIGGVAVAGIFALNEHEYVYDGSPSWPGIVLVIGPDGLVASCCSSRDDS